MAERRWGKTRPSSGRRAAESLPTELTDAAHGQRIQKALADAGVASRRDAEKWIADGRVSVNGVKIVKLPVWIDPRVDRVDLDGVYLLGPRRPGRGSDRAPAGKKRAGPGKLCVMLYKPRRVVSTVRDPEGRTTVLDLLPDELLEHQRLYPVGRLDADSTGLILLTNDGELAHHLTHPSFGVTKQYLVAIRGHISAEDVEKLREGLILTHKSPAPGTPGSQSPRAKAAKPGPKVRRAKFESLRVVKFERDDTRGDRTILEITLAEGQNREIRRLLARLGLKVRRLRRVAIGPLRLKGLAVGEWRRLTPKEHQMLYRAAGVRR
ncbi:MAG: rRNA pseudouridine synthase [Phycisphaeraceae bacterium]|nr:rRNA pseudouridine synthase [Phycisphaeraceae bacterium]